MPLIHIGVTIHGGFVRIAKKTLYFRQKAGLVALNGQEMTGSAVNDGLGDAGVARDGADGDKRAGRCARGGKAGQRGRRKPVTGELVRPWVSLYGSRKP